MTSLQGNKSKTPSQLPGVLWKKGKNAKKSIYLIQVLLNTTTSIDLNVHLKVPFQSETLTQDNSEKRHHILCGVITVMEPQEEEAQNLR